MCETPSGRGTRSMTASASAIAGTSLGCTNDADSIRRAPAAIAWLISSTFASVSRTARSFCSPSRGLTSTMPTMARPPVVSTPPTIVPPPGWWDRARSPGRSLPDVSCA